MGIRGITVSDVRGFGAQGGSAERQAGIYTNFTYMFILQGSYKCILYMCSWLKMDTRAFKHGYYITGACVCYMFVIHSQAMFNSFLYSFPHLIFCSLQALSFLRTILL